MLDFYTLEKARLARLDALPADPAALAWIDLDHPTKEEEDRIQQMLGIEIPTREDMAEIEISS